VQGVGAEHRVVVAARQPVVDVELQRRRRVGQPRLVEPQPDAGQVRRDVGALPDEVRQRRREMNRVLAGAAADLEHAAPVGEALVQQCEDRLAVAFAGRREGLFHRRRCVACGRTVPAQSDDATSLKCSTCGGPAKNGPTMARHCAKAADSRKSTV
jgi:hypothetical protein